MAQSETDLFYTKNEKLISSTLIDYLRLEEMLLQKQRCLLLPLDKLKKASNKSKENVLTEKEPLLKSQRRNSFIEVLIEHKESNEKGKIWLGFYIIAYCVFLILGGLIFQYLELPTEHLSRERFRVIRSEFLNKYPDMKDKDLEDFIADIVQTNNRGISPLKNASTELSWDFGQSLFFSSTVVTTIGYGHVTPLSKSGKIFCIIYATIGIPLTLVLLSAVVERLLIPVNMMLKLLNSKLGHLYQPFNIRLLHLFIIIVLVAFLFLVIPTFIFAYLEESWELLDSFYYCFISLTTIGLGDYIPGDSPEQQYRSLYKIATTFYLLLGLIGLILVLNIFYDIPQLNLGQLFTENNTDETEKLRLCGVESKSYFGSSGFGLYIPQTDEEILRDIIYKK